MKVWQRAMVSTAVHREAIFHQTTHSDDEEHGQRIQDAFGKQVFASRIDQEPDNAVLPISQSAFEHARSQLQFAKSCGWLSPEQEKRELDSLREAHAQVEACRKALDKLIWRWEYMTEMAQAAPAGNHMEAERQAKMVKMLADLGAQWLLPSFIAWGDDRPVSLDFWRERLPTILNAAKIDDQNGFVVCDNLDANDGESFRMCAVVVLLAERGGIDPAVAEEILSNSRAMSQAREENENLEWSLLENGLSSMVEDEEGLGPMAIAALEALALKNAMRAADPDQAESLGDDVAAAANGSRKSPKSAANGSQESQTTSRRL